MFNLTPVLHLALITPVLTAPGKRESSSILRPPHNAGVISRRGITVTTDQKRVKNVVMMMIVVIIILIRGMEQSF